MNIKIQEKIELRLDDKKIVLTREDAKKLVKLLQDTLEIPPQEKIIYQYVYQWGWGWWYNPQPIVNIPSVRIEPTWMGSGDTTGTITSSASTLPDGEMLTFTMDKGA